MDDDGEERADQLKAWVDGMTTAQLWLLCRWVVLAWAARVKAERAGAAGGG